MNSHLAAKLIVSMIGGGGIFGPGIAWLMKRRQDKQAAAIAKQRADSEEDSAAVRDAKVVQGMALQMVEPLNKRIHELEIKVDRLIADLDRAHAALMAHGIPIPTAPQ